MSARSQIIDREFLVGLGDDDSHMSGDANIPAVCAIADHAADMLSVEEEDGRLVYVSPSCRALFGWSQHDMRDASLLAFCHDADCAMVETQRAQLHDQYATVRYRYRLRCPTGQYRWVESRSCRDSTYHIVTITRDVDEEMARIAELERLASYDVLTDLFNRRAIDSALHAELSRGRRHGETVSVALFDVDGFKHINDTQGHLEGDLLLQNLSRCLARSKRTYDVLGRWGGDEFLLIFPKTQPSEAAAIARRIYRAVKLQLPNVSLSFGIGSNLRVDTPDGLLGEADRALYRAKHRGGNGIMMADRTANSP